MQVILQFIVYHSFSVVDWREGGIDLDEFIEEVHRFVELLLPVVEETYMVQSIDVCGVYCQSVQVILLLLLQVAQLLVAECAIVVSLEVALIRDRLTWVDF